MPQKLMWNGCRFRHWRRVLDVAFSSTLSLHRDNCWRWRSDYWNKRRRRLLHIRLKNNLHNAKRYRKCLSTSMFPYVDVRHFDSQAVNSFSFHLAHICRVIGTTLAVQFQAVTPLRNRNEHVCLLVERLVQPSGLFVSCHGDRNAHVLTSILLHNIKLMS